MVERDPNLPSIYQLVRGRVYIIQSRNLSIGVWDGERGFIGIRTKFRERYLFKELHWDVDNLYGTVSGAKDLGIDVPPDIEIRETFDPVDRKTKRPVLYSEKGNGWHFEGETAVNKDIDPVRNQNAALFSFLKKIELSQKID